MQEIIASLEGLSIGAPQVHRNLALFPPLNGEDKACTSEVFHQP